MTDAERFVEVFTERWSHPDPEQLADVQHPDGRLRHPGMDRFIGHDEIPAYLRRLLSVSPVIKLVPIRWASKGDIVFIEWQMSGTFSGQQLQWDGATRFTLRGDRAVEGVGYFDTFPLLEQLDPSLKEKNLLAAVDSEE